MRDEQLSLAPQLPTALDRREFLAVGAATGFALAVQPVSAQTISTAADGLVAGPISIPTAKGPLPGYAARPQGAGSFPIILVVQEIFGVHEHIKDVCRRFAKAGWLAIAPELYHRVGDPSKITDIPQILKDIVSKVADTDVMADLDAAYAWGAASAQGDAKKLAITGFCWGGRITWLYAAHQPALKAGVAWYGRLVGDPSPNTPKHPVDLAASLKAPVLGLYGGQDQGIPVDTVEKMRAALAAAGNKSEIIVYPDAPHAFHADYRPSYRAEAAADGWKRCLAFLQAKI